MNHPSASSAKAVAAPGTLSPEGSHSATYNDDAFITDDQPAIARVPSKKPNGLITVQPLTRAEMQPSYAQDMGTANIEHGVYGSFMHTLGTCLGLVGAVPCCPLPNPYREIPQGNVGLVSRFGQFYKAVDPGLTTVNVCTESVKTVDIRIRMDSIPSQSVMTKDNVTIEIDSVVCWHVVNPYAATFGINNVVNALIERAQTTLRQVVGARTVQSVVTEREAIAAEVEEIVEAPASSWGVRVESILIRDIKFSRELQESLSAAAQAKRSGEAKVIAARAEVSAARLMRDAADILNSPAALSIRTLDALQTMARQANTKVVFVPMNLSNMSVGAPGTGPGSIPGHQVTFPQIAEQAGEGNFMTDTQGPAGQAGMINSMQTI